MNTTSFEVSLVVSDYRGDFEKCAADTKAALKEAVNELGSIIGLDSVRALSLNVKFVEFNSGNPSHADAIFGVTVFGPSRLISKIAKGRI